MKIRFVGGPFGGRTKEMNVPYGSNDIVMRGPKRMTRKQKYEATVSFPNPAWGSDFGRPPVVEARYKIAMRTHTNGQHLTTMPCMHPDGSIFYEYVEGSKVEM